MIGVPVGEDHSTSWVPPVDMSSLGGLDVSVRAFFFLGDPFFACLVAKNDAIDELTCGAASCSVACG